MAKRPKIKTFSFADWDARHYQQTQQYVDVVDKLFKAATSRNTRAYCSSETYVGNVRSHGLI